MPFTLIRHMEAFTFGPQFTTSQATTWAVVKIRTFNTSIPVCLTGRSVRHVCIIIGSGLARGEVRGSSRMILQFSSNTLILLIDLSGQTAAFQRVLQCSSGLEARLQGGLGERHLWGACPSVLAAPPISMTSAQNGFRPDPPVLTLAEPGAS